ncbi:hypothetical protein ACFYXJ_06485 [Streptomyces sp. NPDC002667]|uniref:hypothetical protein n=1 Tax=Streptomyces sp. NPDC002667 TaxID=3364657 RepID=UPI0036ADC5D2
MNGRRPRCLLVPSGRLTDPYGDPGSDPYGKPDGTDAVTEQVPDPDRQEQELWRSLAAVLRARDADVAHVTFPSRTEDGRAADPEEVADRVARVRSVARVSTPDVVVALSLGAHATVQAFAGTGTAPERGSHTSTRLVLVGFVTEREEQLSNAVSRVDLVYGAGDLIAYVPAGHRAVDPRTTTVLAPGQYAGEVARRLSADGDRDVRIHVLEGLGHRLQPVPSGRPGPSRPDLGRLETTGLPSSPPTAERVANIVLPMSCTAQEFPETGADGTCGRGHRGEETT